MNPTLLCRLALLCLGLAGACPGTLRAGDEVVAAWELVGRHLANDALAGLTKLRANGGREAAFAEAVVRMDSQPVTEAGLKQAWAEKNPMKRFGTPDEVANAVLFLASSESSSGVVPPVRVSNSSGSWFPGSAACPPDFSASGSATVCAGVSWPMLLAPHLLSPGRLTDRKATV